ncbi:hypothetical protein [Aureimonas sp. AU40]|uniref:hypothetical protein n=1 Tax=Aureimonas sp. AU40 TaxID=1637747 RepID=UPI0007834725|nr:hypothetical protein [Aureimonas sp. AU40]
MSAASPCCRDEGALAQEAPALRAPTLRARAERVAAWRRPRAVLDGTLLAASLLLCAALLGGLI